MVGVELALYRGKAFSLKELVSQTTTNDKGEFRFVSVVDAQQAFPAGVPPEASAPDDVMFVVVARHAGRTSREAACGQSYLYRDGQAIDFVMLPGAKLAGRVVDDAGNPVAGALVSKILAMSGAEGLWSARTNADGAFEITDLDSFDFTAERRRAEAADREGKEQLASGKVDSWLSVSLAPTFVVTHPGFAYEKLKVASIPGNANVVLRPGGTIVGQVKYSDGTPAAGVVVQAYTSVPKLATDWGIAMFDHGAVDVAAIYQTAVRTDAAGRYEFNSLRAGQFDIWAEAAGWLNRGNGELEVKAGESTPSPDLILTKGGEIRVQLVDDATGKPIAPENGLRAEVMVMPAHWLSRQDLWPNSVSVAKDATLTVSSIPGKMRLHIKSLEVNGKSRWAPVEASLVKLPLLEVDEGEAVETRVKVRQSADSGDKSDAKAKTETKHAASLATGYATFVAVKGSDPLKPASAYKENTLAYTFVDEGGKAVAGATVSLYRVDHRNGDRELVNKATTNDAGQVEFADLCTAAELENFKRLRDKQDFYGSDVQRLLIAAVQRDGLATIILLQNLYGVGVYGSRQEAMMPPARELSGRVTGPDGRPAAGALVAAGGFASSMAIEGVNAVRTDGEGRFVFKDRPPLNAEEAQKSLQANMWLAAKATEAMTEEELAAERSKVGQDLQASNIVVTHADFAVMTKQGGDIPGTVDVQLRPAATLLGQVVDETGKGVAGVLVRTSGQPVQEEGETKAEAVARFRYSHHAASTRSDENG